MRQAWRRSDGPGHGKISEYRHDALGREVSTRTWWELARRCYLDTRFELDIDTDFDGDGNKLKLVDGGMTSDQPAPIGQLGQRAAWSSRINRLSDRDAHYFDFLIDVPALAGNQHANYLLGVLAYEQAEVRIYPARYELVIGGTPVGTHNVASTAGRHNLGICAKGALSGEVSECVRGSTP